MTRNIDGFLRVLPKLVVRAAFISLGQNKGSDFYDIMMFGPIVNEYPRL